MLSACASVQQKSQSGRGPPQASGFSFKQLAKTDVDRVAEAHLQENLATLRLITEKLYRRNPREWRKVGQPSLEAAVARIFENRTDWNFPELRGAASIDSIHLAFRDDYQGDRVLAFMAGMTRMVMLAYNDQTEFYITDQLNPQKLYSAARNVEIAAWKLSNARNLEGQLYLLSNELDPANRNLSYEREMGRLIGQLDVMARIMADRDGRTIVKVVHNLATAVFLPIR